MGSQQLSGCYIAASTGPGLVVQADGDIHKNTGRWRHLFDKLTELFNNSQANITSLEMGIKPARPATIHAIAGYARFRHGDN